MTYIPIEGDPLYVPWQQAHEGDPKIPVTVIGARRNRVSRPAARMIAAGLLLSTIAVSAANSPSLAVPRGHCLVDSIVTDQYQTALTDYGVFDYTISWRGIPTGALRKITYELFDADTLAHIGERSVSMPEPDRQTAVIKVPSAVSPYTEVGQVGIAIKTDLGTVPCGILNVP